MISDILTALDGVSDKVTRRHLAQALRRAIRVYTSNDLPGRVSSGLEVSTEEEQLGLRVGKIAAIKAYRDRTKKGLRESKEAVEKHFDTGGLNFY